MFTKQSNRDSINFKGLDYGIKLNQPEPLFIRIDKEKKLEELRQKNV